MVDSSFQLTAADPASANAKRNFIASRRRRRNSVDSDV